jgi:hypothetical protein
LTTLPPRPVADVRFPREGLLDQPLGCGIDWITGDSPQPSCMDLFDTDAMAIWMGGMQVK